MLWYFRESRLIASTIDLISAFLGSLSKPEFDHDKMKCVSKSTFWRPCSSIKNNETCILNLNQVVLFAYTGYQADFKFPPNCQICQCPNIGYFMLMLLRNFIMKSIRLILIVLNYWLRFILHTLDILRCGEKINNGCRNQGIYILTNVITPPHHESCSKGIQKPNAQIVKAKISLITSLDFKVTLYDVNWPRYNPYETNHDSWRPCLNHVTVWKKG